MQNQLQQLWKQYTLERVANLRISYTYAGLRSQLCANYTGSQFTDELNTKPIVENTSGFFIGKIDAYTIVDLITRYTLNDQVEFYGAVKKLRRQALYPKSTSRNLCWS